MINSTWTADVLHYLVCGFLALVIEWTLLRNGLRSNAFQLGMFAMWTTFCYGPRILIRDLSQIKKARRHFWLTFGVFAVLLTTVVLLTSDQKAKIVIVVLGLSRAYILGSGWLLVRGWLHEI